MTQEDVHAEQISAAKHSALKRYDVEAIRQDFPILHQKVHGRRLAFLDSAASTQKPQCVIDAVSQYYSHDNANVHRGVYLLSQRATDAFEGARERVRQFLNAASDKEIVFTRGATEAINLVAQSFGAHLSLQPGDEILITHMEHHSNIVPWQMLCQRTGALLKVAPVGDDGALDLPAFEALLSPKTRMVAVVHVSNSLGTINPVRQIVRLAHDKGVPVLIDGAQAAPHEEVDVRALDCDFYVFSGHKIYGPTGIGVLYGKHEHLLAMPPYQGGGDMILSVTFEKTVYNRAPFKFEAGTPNIAGAVGLGAAIDYVSRLGLPAIAAHEHELLNYANECMQSIENLRFIGTAPHKVGVVAFVLGDIHAHDIGTITDKEGVAIRSGHHCTQPLMARFGVPATARASFGLYTNRQDIDQFIGSLQRVREVFQ